MSKLIITLLFTLFITGAASAKQAVIVAAFGSTHADTLRPILLIRDDIKAAFPESKVRLAFTSNIIRKIWHERDTDCKYHASHPDIPQEIFKVKNVLGAAADLQNEGYKDIIIQPVLISAGEEYMDTKAYAEGLISIQTLRYKWKPFHDIKLGAPLTGGWGDEISEAVETAADALIGDCETAEKENAALVYMGHGNERFSTGVYSHLEAVMTEKCEVPVIFGLVEGFPDIKHVQNMLKKSGAKKVLLKPFMITAGDHAKNDMAGDDDDSFKSILEKDGYSVSAVIKGLGEIKAVRDIYVKNAKNAQSVR